MWLVLCSSADHAAMWAFNGLKELGLAPLELVTSECLAYSRLWEHRLGASGVHIKIGLPDGRMICSSRVRGALNRLLSPPPELVNLAVAADREYATAEMSALYMSWLHGLPGPVLNRSTPQGICGRWRHRSEWAWLASRAGLPIAKFEMSGRDPIEAGYYSLAPSASPVTSVIMLGDEVIGKEVPTDIVAGCRRFMELAETDLLGIDFYVEPSCTKPSSMKSGGDWKFANASPFPDLTLGGRPLLERLAHILQNGDKQ